MPSRIVLCVAFLASLPSCATLPQVGKAHALMEDAMAAYSRGEYLRSAPLFRKVVELAPALPDGDWYLHHIRELAKDLLDQGYVLKQEEPDRAREMMEAVGLILRSG